VDTAKSAFFLDAHNKNQSMESEFVPTNVPTNGAVWLPEWQQRRHCL
jgi:hypothetical protein